MPTLLKTETVAGWAHCVNRKGQCPGYEQQQVEAIVDEIGITSAEKGGELGGMVENTHTYVRFADRADAVCPICRSGSPDAEGVPQGPLRELTLQPRKVYEQIAPGEHLAPVPAGHSDAERIAELEAKLKVLMEQRDAA